MSTLKTYGFLAIALFLFCVDISAQTNKLLEDGHEFFAQKEYVKALESYENAYNDFLKKGNKKAAVASIEYIAKANMHQYKTDLALKHYHRMASLSKEAGWSRIYADALNSIMVIKNFRGQIDSAEIYARKVLKSEVITYQDSSDAYNILATSSIKNLKYDSAEYFVLKAIDLDKMHNDSSSLPFNFSALAAIKSRQGKNSEALNLSIEGSSWLRPGRDDFKKITVYRDISGYFLTIRNLPKAKEYINESVELAKKFKTKNNLAYSLMDRAYVSEKEEKFEEALKDYQQVIEILEGTKTKDALASANLGICNCYLAMDAYDKCGPHLKYYKELSEELKDDPSNLRFALINLELSLNKKSLNEAKIFLEKAEKNSSLTKNVYSRHKMESLKSEYYEQLNKPALALKHFKRKQSLRDSIYVVTQSIAMSEMESRFNKKENELEITKLELKDHKSQVQISKQRAVLVLGGLILFCLSYLIFRIFSQKKQIETQNEVISQSLKEKELLLKEIHHRVKNNLQIISSLLSLQGQYIDDPNINRAIQEGRNRVKSMSLIHQNLYQKDNLAGVQVKDYMIKLFENLFDSYNIAPNRISLITEIDEIDLDIDTIIPLGLVINELLTNSLKYAFPDERKGEVKLTIREEQDQLFVAVQDDGVGIKNPEQLSSSQSFGFELIEAFQQKLKAELEIDGENGTRVSLKIRNYKKVA